MLQFIFKEASPNAIVEINSPPTLWRYLAPCRGWITTSMSVQVCLILRPVFLAIFLERISSNAFIPAHQYGKYM